MTPIGILLLSLVVVGLSYLGAVAAVAIIAAVRRGGRRDDPEPGHEALAVSRFTIPVSIVVPVDAGSPSPIQLVDDLAALSYPEFEIIVVAAGLSNERLDALAGTWGLESKEFFYRHTLNTAPVRRIFRSARDTRLMLVEKLTNETKDTKATGGSRADAINCGCNLARYRYVAVVSPEISVERDALLRAMSPALLDPSHVAATVSHIERRPSESHQPTGGWPRLTARFQQLASVRAFMESRIFAPRTLPEPAVHDAVVVWRRDALLDAGGLRPAVINPEADLMVRLPGTKRLDSQQGALTVRTGEIFGYASALPLDRVLEGATGRQAAALRLARTVGNPASRRYLVAREILTPAVQIVVVGALIGGTTVGVFTVWHLMTGVLALAMGAAAVTVAALLVRGASPETPELPELIQLVIASALEPLLHRPRLLVAKVKGIWLGVVPSP